MQNNHSLYYEPTKFKEDEEGVESYQTASREIIAYKSVLQQDGLNGKLGNKAGSGALQRKGNLLRNVAPKLKPGEFAVVERRYS